MNEEEAELIQQLVLIIQIYFNWNEIIWALQMELNTI